MSVIKQHKFSSRHEMYEVFDTIFEPEGQLASALRLSELGFNYYSRNFGKNKQKTRRWSRQVTAPELDKVIKTSWGDKLLADDPDYYIMYDMIKLPTVTDFQEHVKEFNQRFAVEAHLHPVIVAVEQAGDCWLIRGDVFRKNYVTHLQYGDVDLFNYNQYGLPIYASAMEKDAAESFQFVPCAKTGGTIARLVLPNERVGVISLEHLPQAKNGEYIVAEVPAHCYVIIGSEGEPYWNEPAFFSDTYHTELLPVANSEYYAT